jgi:hypothetical protein
MKNTDVMKNIAELFKAGPLGACCIGLPLLIAQPCAAQQAVCVNLLFGSGYATWMAVEFNNTRYWSKSFPVCQYDCVKLPVPGMVDGAPYKVIIYPVLGHTWNCTPNPTPYSSKAWYSLTYHASGTVQDAVCEMPFGTPSSDATAMTPSKEGLEALEKWKKEGPKPFPQ